MKAFNTLVVVALSLLFSKNTAEATPVGRSLLPDLPLSGGILGSILGGRTGNLDVVPATSRRDTAGASDGAGSVGNIGSRADSFLKWISEKAETYFDRILDNLLSNPTEVGPATGSVGDMGSAANNLPGKLTAL